jgi:hypothetical protein
MKNLDWISYPLFLIPLFFTDREILLGSGSATAAETENFQLDPTLAALLLTRQPPEVDPAPTPTTPVGLPRQQFDPPAVVTPIAPPISPTAPPVPPPRLPRSTADPRFFIAPRAVELQQVNPRTTEIPINGVHTGHRSEYEVTAGVESSDVRNTTTSINAIKLYSPYVEESISRQGVYRIEYTNTYNQIKTVRQRRDLTTTLVEPQTILGMRQQISLIGDCLNLTSGGSSSVSAGAKQLCTYLPGIFTDNTSIDPDRLIPTRILQPSKFGEVVSPESLAAMRQPGFQAGANGQQLGVDLYFPKIGTTEGNSSNATAKIERRETQINVPAVTMGRIQQVLVSNGEQSGISRTIRGFTFVLSDRNTVTNSGFQLLSSILPNAEPQLSPGIPGRVAGINPNLVLAANNTRLPENSFTTYSAGWGYAKNRNDTDRIPPQANYNTIWFGLSPIVDRQISSSSAYRTTSPQRIMVDAGGEGGAQSAVNTIAAINDKTFNSASIASAYSQIYLTLFEQDANRLATTRLRETTEYYPHLSFSGNTTTVNSVFRYYTGAILNAGLAPRQTGSHIKAYGGIDFTRSERSGLSYNIAAVGYTNPDPEYYSRITTNVSQRISLGKNSAHNLAVSAGFNYAIDGATQFDKLRFQSGNSFINTGVTLNLGNVSLNATYFIPNSLPNPIDSLLSTSITWRIKDNIAVGGYYTPINNNALKSPYGINAAFKFGTDLNSPTLMLNWNRNDLSFGQSAAGTSLSTNENVFSIALGFGEPLTPAK